MRDQVICLLPSSWYESLDTAQVKIARAPDHPENPPGPHFASFPRRTSPVAPKSRTLLASHISVPLDSKTAIDARGWVQPSRSIRKTKKGNRRSIASGGLRASSLPRSSGRISRPALCLFFLLIVFLLLRLRTLGVVARALLFPLNWLGGRVVMFLL
jgi:hypothetical protein